MAVSVLAPLSMQQPTLLQRIHTSVLSGSSATSGLTRFKTSVQL